MTDKPTPTDAELKAMWQPHAADIGGILDFASAVLEKWGQPAQAAEPVAWLDPWTGAKVTTDYDAYGKHGTPLYTAPQPSHTAQAAASVQEDAARLDFLIDQVAYVVSDPDTRPGHWLHWARPDGSTWVQIGEYPTPRAAIDEARKQEEKQ